LIGKQTQRAHCQAWQPRDSIVLYQQTALLKAIRCSSLTWHKRGLPYIIGDVQITVRLSGD
jgi:hypothetical protein